MKKITLDSLFKEVQKIKSEAAEKYLNEWPAGKKEVDRDTKKFFDIRNETLNDQEKNNG